MAPQFRVFYFVTNNINYIEQDKDCLSIIKASSQAKAINQT
jgi:hypothetical protein